MEELEQIDLNDSIRRAAELARKRVRHSCIDMDLKLSPSAPRVLAPADELTQAMLSLFTNSAQMVSSSARSSGRIQITSAVIHDRVLVSVMDDVPANETDANLRLSRSKIREIGGDLWLSSKEPFGTTLMIDLPLAVGELTTL